MKIAVCDDDREVLSRLSRYIREYAGKNLLDYTVLEFESGELLLEAAAADPDIRILFLDIYMTPLSGMELAEKLRDSGNECAIIFVTISTDHYAGSYEVNAVHYLVKPITSDRIDAAMARCGQFLSASAKCATFLSGGKELRIPLNQIRFVEVFRNRTVIHAGSLISLRCTLENAARQLDDPRFLRTHRSYLVNMDYIARQCGNDILLKTGETVPLSRAGEKIFEREYGRYLTNSMTGGIL
ncbi:LytR/AlgR family response regulator transcription factor [[Clostridium] symbiosum]|uniref:LytR/AlgR family response regulator transcription factor n=1 Tax=Clostridium symbiosum TaxID=1512 RepID=UPI00192E06FE|nr:LytTR family DNA-binding domain-containing protein [[Clostridium] symbiosum]